MRKAKVFAAVMVMLLLAQQTQAGVSLIMNGSFESDGIINDIAVEAPRRWCDVNLPAGQFGGKVETIWKTYGDYSLSLYSGYGMFNAGDMATISQEVYLADVSQIIFDLRLGTYAGFAWDPVKRSALLLIDGDVIWDSSDWTPDASGEYRNQMVDVNESYAAILATSSIGHWKMNDNEPNTTVIDSSGNGNDGTFNDATGNPNTDAHSDAGKINGALSFDGTDDFVDIGNVIGTGAYTKVAWIKRADAASYNNIVSGTSGHAFWAPSSQSFKLSSGHNGSWYLVQDSEDLAVDTWYHVAVTFDPAVDSGTMVLYKDGALVSGPKAVATGVAPPSPSATTYIGRYASGYYFEGAIDNVMVFDKVLTGAEIETLYTGKDAGLHTLSLAIRANVTGMEYAFNYLAQWDFVKFDTYCGGFGYLPEDFNFDCYVDMLDLKVLAGQWLAGELNQHYDLFSDDEDIINFPDFATFSSYWQDTNCPQTVWCGGSDFNRSGTVDFSDLKIFADHWLGQVVFLLSDLAEDDVVNFKDFAFFAEMFTSNTDWKNWQEENCFEMELLAGDLDNNGIVNLRDLAILIGDLKSEGPCIRSDIDDSGIVDYRDIAKLADEWLLKSWLYGLE